MASSPTLDPKTLPKTGKNLIICCDGTSNQFGVENTNVVRLAQIVLRDPTKQHLYYDPGVGTLPEPGFATALGRKLTGLLGLALGRGIEDNVAQAYTFLMDFWERGDRVYLFGFSRGAYTVRVLAGLLHHVGLLPRGNYNLIPYIQRLYAALKGKHAKSEGAAEYWQLGDDFRWSFARPMFDGDNERRFRTHFLGVWDTVSSVGWFWNPARYPFTANNPSVGIVRHAIAVDERRWFFRQNQLYRAGDQQDFQELWFPGVHADVGGGYPLRDGGLWREPFNWIVSEAQAAFLQVDEERKAKDPQDPPAYPWIEYQHESLTWKWWPFEFFPKFQSQGGGHLKLPRFGLFGKRYLKNGSLLHKSTLLRLREMAYKPRNMSDRFIQEVQGLPSVPEQMPFQW